MCSRNFHFTPYSYFSSSHLVKRKKISLRKVKIAALCFFQCSFVFDFVCVVAMCAGQCKMKRAAFYNHLHRLCSSSSFFLIFNCRASSISSFVLLGFLETVCSSSSFFTVCTEQNRCEFKYCHCELQSHQTYIVRLIGGRQPQKDVYLFFCLLFLYLHTAFFFLLTCFMLFPRAKRHQKTHRVLKAQTILINR